MGAGAGMRDDDGGWLANGMMNDERSLDFGRDVRFEVMMNTAEARIFEKHGVRFNMTVEEGTGRDLCSRKGYHCLLLIHFLPYLIRDTPR